MNVRNVAVAVVCCLCLEVKDVRADAAFSARITDATYWHHYTYYWDDSSGLAWIMFFKDPDPARAYTGEWCQFIGDCSTDACPVTVAGRLPPYSPGRLRGHIVAHDPDIDDPCHDAPSVVKYNLRGRGVETWIYRKSDLLPVLDFHGTWCATPSTDSAGNELFEVRRQIAALALVPRIARGALDFTWTNAEGGPAAHLSITGKVLVERDPTTLAPVFAFGRFDFYNHYSGTPLQMLQHWYDVVVPEVYGITCDAARPQFSDNAAAHAGTFSEKVKLTLTY